MESQITRILISRETTTTFLSSLAFAIPKAVAIITWSGTLKSKSVGKGDGASATDFNKPLPF